MDYCGRQAVHSGNTMYPARSRRHLQLYLFVLTHSLVVWRCSSQDPCTQRRIFPSVDERNPANVLGAGKTSLNDLIFPRGWYGDQGRQLSTSAPGPDRCGARFPIWLKSSTGTVATLCIQRDAVTPCWGEISVNTKDCGPYKVYDLKPTGQLNSAYCVELTNPDEVPPVYTNKPTVDVRLVDRTTRTSELQYDCRFPQSTTDGLLYSVHWYVNDMLIHSFDPLPWDQVATRAFLTETILRNNGLRGPGFEVKCSVQARKMMDGPASVAQIADGKHIGFEVLTKIVMLKEGECKDVEVRMTAPFGCGTDIPDNECKLFTQVYSLDMPGKCGMAAITGTICGTTPILKNMWNQPARVKVCGRIGQMYGSNSAILRLKLRTSVRMASHEFWQNYDLGDIRVQVTRDTSVVQGKRCSATNDPHMTTFRGRLYEHHIDGTFTLYKHKTLPLEVQLSTRRCGGGNARCNCGLAVRAGKTVYVIDRCGQRTWLTGYSQIEEGENLLKVRRNGNSYQIVLPTGGRVDVQLRGQWLNAYITPSVKDVEASQGLCGKLTTTCNDLVLRNGALSSDAYATSCNKGRRYYRAFSESWRVPNGQNLFSNPVREAWPRSELYCTCPADPTVATTSFVPRVQCNALKASQECINVGGFKEVTALPIRRPARRRRRSVEIYSPSVLTHGLYRRQANETAGEWRNGWSEERAEEHCSGVFNRSRSLQLCQGVPEVSSAAAIEDCVLDIKEMGDTTFTVSAVDSVRTKCVHEVLMNATLHEPGETGQPSVLSMIMEEVACINDCSLNGTCVNGSCVCDVGKGGVDCSVDVTKPPTLTEVLHEEGCRLDRDTCNQTTVYGETFLDSRDLKCKVQRLSVYEDGTIKEGSVDVVESVVDSINEVTCDLPSLQTTSTQNYVQGFRLSVANTGELYSNTVDMVVFDPTCQKLISGQDLRWRKTSSAHCIHTGRCVANGNQVSGKQCPRCQATEDAIVWTNADGSACVETSGSTRITSHATLAVTIAALLATSL